MRRLGLLLFVQQSTFIQPRWLSRLRIILLTHATRLDTELGEATDQQQADIFSFQLLNM